MTRLRENFKTGVLSADLSNVATTISSTQFAGLPEVASPDYMIVVLDPQGLSGNPEIVKVTAHTAASPTITVVRGEEGTIARAHVAGMTWRHALTAFDLDDAVTKSTDQTITGIKNGLGTATDLVGYVSAGARADNANDGTSWASPMATLAAARAAGFKQIKVGYGSFTAPGAFFDDNDIWVEGTGMALTTLVGTGNGTGLSKSGIGIRRRCRVSDLTIDFQSGGTAGHRCLELDDFFEGTFERVRFLCPSTAAGADGTCVKFIGDAAGGKSTYFNSFIDCQYQSGYRCWDLGDDCNANFDTRGKFDGDGVAIYCVPTATHNTGTCVFNGSKLQTSGVNPVVVLGGGAGTCTDWTWIAPRVETGGASEMQWNAGASRHQWLGGSVANEVSWKILGKTLNGYWNIPSAGIYRDDRSATPGTTTLPGTVSGANVIAQTMPRNVGMADLTVLATGRLILAQVRLQKGQIIRRIGFCSGATPANTPTNQWFALYDSAGVLLAVTSDDTTTAWGANAFKVLAFSANEVIQTSGIYYVGVMVTATTPPTLRGAASLDDILGLSPIMAFADPATGLTNPASAPDPFGTPVPISNLPYAYLSE